MSWGGGSSGTRTGLGSSMGSSYGGYANTNAPKPAFGMATGGFGANRTGVGSTGSMYGANRTGTGMAGFGTGRTGFTTPTVNYQAVLMKDPLFERVWNLRCAYNPDSTAYRFCYVFYNKRLNDAIPQPPANIQPNEWVKVLQDCPDPDNLIPVPIYGFSALKERSDTQKQLEKDISQRIALIRAKLRSMTLFFSTEIVGNYERIKHNNNSIGQLMMTNIGNEEVQRLQGARLSTAEQEILNRLDRMKVSLSKPNAFKNAIETLQTRSVDFDPNRSINYTLDKESLTSIAEALNNNQECLGALERSAKVLKRRTALLELSMSDLKK